MNFKLLIITSLIFSTFSLFAQINKDAILKDNYFERHKINLSSYMWDDEKLNAKIDYLHKFRENPIIFFMIGTSLDMLGSALIIDAVQNDRQLVSLLEGIGSGILIATSIPFHVLCITSTVKQYKFKKTLQEKFQY